MTFTFPLLPTTTVVSSHYWFPTHISLFEGCKVPTNGLLFLDAGAVNNNYFVVVCQLDALVAVSSTFKRFVNILFPFPERGRWKVLNIAAQTSLHSTAVRVDSKPFLSFATIADDMSAL